YDVNTRRDHCAPDFSPRPKASLVRWDLRARARVIVKCPNKFGPIRRIRSLPVVTEGNWSKREHCFTFLNVCCHLLAHSGTQTQRTAPGGTRQSPSMVLLFRR